MLESWVQRFLTMALLVRQRSCTKQYALEGLHTRRMGVGCCKARRMGVARPGEWGVARPGNRS